MVETRHGIASSSDPTETKYTLWHLHYPDALAKNGDDDDALLVRRSRRIDIATLLEPYRANSPRHTGHSSAIWIPKLPSRSMTGSLHMSETHEDMNHGIRDLSELIEISQRRSRRTYLWITRRRRRGRTSKHRHLAATQGLRSSCVGP